MGKWASGFDWQGSCQVGNFTLVDRVIHKHMKTSWIKKLLEKLKKRKSPSPFPTNGIPFRPVMVYVKVQQSKK